MKSFHAHFQITAILPIYKRRLLLIIISWLTHFAHAQEVKKTFTFREVPIAQATKEIVEAYGLYVSFDPAIFKNKPPISLNFEEVTMKEGLTRLLQEAYSYEVINDYVVINPVERVVDQSLDPKPSSIISDSIIYDTLIIEKVRIIYDTIIIESIKETEVVDTIKVEKQVIIYDTVRYITEPKTSRNQWMPYFTPLVWLNEDDRLPGVGLGLSFRHTLENFHLEAGISYSYFQQSTQFSQLETFTELQVDTLSTFFIIENEERIPVYVIDSTEVDREVIREIDRTGDLHMLSAKLLVGKAFELNKRMQLGVNLGFSADWIFHQNEIIVQNEAVDEELATRSYQLPLANVRMEIPFFYKGRTLSEGYFLSPCVELGLNEDFRNMNTNTQRVRLGIKVGVVF